MKRKVSLTWFRRFWRLRKSLNFTHRITHFLYANWWVKRAFNPNKKACNHLIFRLLMYFVIETGGERGIRTLDTLLAYTHFPGVLFRPLRHLSLFCYWSLVTGHRDITYFLAALMRLLTIDHNKSLQRYDNIALVTNKKYGVTAFY